jgi:adenylyltransferase/sulfurtransferase
VLAGKPNVYGSVFRWEGQVSVFAMPGGPCYRCLFREPPPPGLVLDCAEGGVLGVLPGVIGSLQAMETVKLILGVGRTLAGRLLLFDALDMTWREVAVRRNPACPVCGDHPTQTGLIDYELFCGITRAPEDGPSVPELEPARVLRLLGGDAPPTLVDVRERWEWQVGSLGSRGALLVPLAELPGRMAEIPRDRAVVLYCRSGQRSLTAARRLLEAGYAEVYNLQGGLLAWARDVDPGVDVV